MTREAVLDLIRNHLADELEVEPARIEEGTRFKEDLEADSLDLYTLVQELEDSYGVRIPDEEAARILTVGQAVDFVLAHRVGARGGNSTPSWTSSRRTCIARSSPMPAGPSAARTPTRGWPSWATRCWASR